MFFPTENLYCLVTLNGEKQRTKAVSNQEWGEELGFTLFEDIEDGFGHAYGGDPPPPLSPKNQNDPPGIAGGKFAKIACHGDWLHSPMAGETDVDLTEVLTAGETESAFITGYRFPCFHP